MRTERLNIRKFGEEDLNDLVTLLSDAEVMKHLEAPYTKEATDLFLHRCGLTEHPLIYAVEDHEGAFVGYIIYHPYDDSSYEIGWVLNRNHWGKAYAEELTQALIEDARGKCAKLMIECAPEQTATRRIAGKCGFSFAENRDGLDVYELSLL